MSIPVSHTYGAHRRLSLVLREIGSEKCRQIVQRTAKQVYVNMFVLSIERRIKKW